mmetsp:Transcript_32298/g.78207  ORF Transcript_32298/g.78207 Transcript_32298/m.78207 type:complete len:300 (+) Transcript_32298:266-1165(+)
MESQWAQNKTIHSYIIGLLDKKVLKPYPLLRNEVFAVKASGPYKNIENERWYCLVKRASAEWLGDNSDFSDAEEDLPASETALPAVAQLNIPKLDSDSGVAEKTTSEDSKMKMSVDQSNTRKVTTQGERSGSFPYLVYKWEDDRGVQRTHAWVWAPSGSERDSLKNPCVVDGAVQFGYVWPECITDYGIFFGHSRFDDRYYHKGKAVVKCIKKSLDELAGERGHIESIVRIPLSESSQPWVPTPNDVSGHDFVESIVLDHRNPAKRTVLWMFDLQGEAPIVSSETFSERKEAKEDFTFY